MAWIEISERRTRIAKTWRGDDNELRHEHILGTALHYPTAGSDSTEYDGEIDLSPMRVDNAQLDGWRVVQNEWHYALGHPGDKPTDGWVGFGGRQGAHWLQFRLLRAGYLHWPTRAWQDVGGTPTYDRANLNQETEALTIGPEGAKTIHNVQSTATWTDLWTTPGGGSVSTSWRAEGRSLKEEITVNQAAREWIAANHPPETPLAETWFGFVFQLDLADIPQWVINGIPQDPDGDFVDDNGKIELRDALDRLLGFMPASFAYSEDYWDGEEDTQDTVKLRKRIWLDGDGNHYLLVGARADLLNSAHAGAIIFDPTFTTQAADKDNYVYGPHGANDGVNWGASARLYVSNSSTDRHRRALIKFDCSSIPATAICTSATLHLWSVFGGVDHNQIIYAIASGNSGWPEGDEDGGAGGAGDSCWDYYDQASGTETNWAGSEGLSTSGTDYEASSIGTINCSGTGEETASLTAARVEGWFGGTNTNYGIIIGWSDVQNQVPYWRSSEYGTAGERPKLVVVYKEVKTGSLAADAIIKAAQSASVTGDAIIKAAQSGSITCDSIIKAAQSGSFTGDSIIKAAQSGSITADCVIKAAQSGSATADSIIKQVNVSSTITADAIVMVARTGSITASAIIKAAQSGSITADSIIQVEQSDSLTANAIIQVAQSGSITADSIIKQVDVSDSIAADAIIEAVLSGSLAASAIISGAQTGSITASAIIQVAQLGSIAADAILMATQAGSIVAAATVEAAQAASVDANAIIKRTGVSGTITADAMILLVRTGSITASAIIKAAQSGSVTADSTIEVAQSASIVASAIIGTVLGGTILGDAVIKAAQSGSVTADASIVYMQTGSIAADSRIVLDVTSTGPKPRSTPWLRPDIEETKQL